MRDFINEHMSARIFGICYCVLAGILIALAIMCYTLNHSHTYKGHKLKLTSISQNGVTMTDSDGNILTMKVISSSVSFWDMEFMVSYLDETMTCRGSTEGLNAVYNFSDGSSYTQPYTVAYSINGEINKPSLTKLQESEKLLMTELVNFYDNHIPTGFYIGYVLLGLLIILMGEGLFFYPEGFWRFSTMFTVMNGEPTDFAIYSNMLAGIIIVIGIYIGLLYMFMFKP